MHNEGFFRRLPAGGGAVVPLAKRSGLRFSAGLSGCRCWSLCVRLCRSRGDDVMHRRVGVVMMFSYWLGTATCSVMATASRFWDQEACVAQVTSWSSPLSVLGPPANGSWRLAWSFIVFNGDRTPNPSTRRPHRNRRRTVSFQCCCFRTRSHPDVTPPYLCWR